MFSFCFFFQAEDGIRDGHVTGVQTCALPISPSTGSSSPAPPPATPTENDDLHLDPARTRSEERRGGKECSSRWSAWGKTKHVEDTCAGWAGEGGVEVLGGAAQWSDGRGGAAV